MTRFESEGIHSRNPLKRATAGLSLYVTENDVDTAKGRWGLRIAHAVTTGMILAGSGLLTETMKSQVLFPQVFDLHNQAGWGAALAIFGLLIENGRATVGKGTLLPSLE